MPRCTRMTPMRFFLIATHSPLRRGGKVMKTTDNRSKGKWKDLEGAAGNGLLDRRAFLRGGAAFAAVITSYSMAESVSAEPLADDPWSKVPGTLSPPYEKRSRYEEKVVRTLSNPTGE